MKTISLTICIFFFSAISFAQKTADADLLPDDLTIILDNTGTIQYALYSRHTISADGAVTVQITNRGLPVIKPLDILMRRKGQEDPKIGDRPQTIAEKDVEKRPKLSREQLIELLQMAKAIEFFSMQDRYEGNRELPEVICVTHSQAKQISITANGQTKNVYFYLGCSYGEFDPLIRFNRLFDEISRMLSDVQVKEIAQ